MPGPRERCTILICFYFLQVECICLRMLKVREI